MKELRAEYDTLLRALDKADECVYHLIGLRLCKLRVQLGEYRYEQEHRAAYPRWYPVDERATEQH